MKKVVAFALAVIFAFSLVACGSNDSGKLTNNPPAAEVKSAISSIPDISNIEIVTEDHDPNHQLGKQGGYTGALFFSSPLVKSDPAKSSIDKGTAGGGCIEIYANANDAKKRDDYLAQFDGGILAAYHKLHGTLVIRLSNSLKASQQQELSQKIIDALS
jgi:hypothetical protein